MPSYLPPKCPRCGEELHRVFTAETSSYTFNPTTGSYDEDAGGGSFDSSCPSCEEDVYDALEDSPGNFQSTETAPCQTPPTTS